MRTTPVRSRVHNPFATLALLAAALLGTGCTGAATASLDRPSAAVGSVSASPSAEPSASPTPAPSGTALALLATLPVKGRAPATGYQRTEDFGAAFGMRRLVEIVRTHPYAFKAPAPKIIIVSPPQVIATTHADLGPMFEGAIAQSQRLAGHYSRAAEELGTGFFDAAKVATPTPVDGIHLDAANTRAIGEGLVPLVKETLGL